MLLQTPRVNLAGQAVEKDRMQHSNAEAKMSDFLSREENKEELEKIQIAAIRHYLTVVKMICFEYSPISDTNTIETLLGLIKKLTFLTCPVCELFLFFELFFPFTNQETLFFIIFFFFSCLVFSFSSHIRMEFFKNC